MTDPTPPLVRKPADEADGENPPAGLDRTDPTDSDHLTGDAQAAENAATESPS